VSDSTQYDGVNGCGAIWEYWLEGELIHHECKLTDGHGGAHESYGAEWSREHEELVPWEHGLREIKPGVWVGLIAFAGSTWGFLLGWVYPWVHRLVGQ